MFAKVATAFGLFALAAQVAVATPPACLIAAVNTQSDPSDVKTVCTAGASDVQSYLSDKCGNNLDAATSAWASYCKDAGVTVSSSSSSSPSSSTASATGSASSTASPSGSHSSGTAHSITSAGQPEGTGAASSGFVTATTNMNGTYAAPSSSSATNAAQSSSAPSGSSNSPSATSSGVITSTGAASRLGMDIVGLTAIGMFGAMLAM